MEKPSTLSDPKNSSVIRKSPHVSSGVACLRETRHSIWGLVQWRNLGLSDDQIRERHPDLTQADLELPWSYYRENHDEIDQIIRNDEDV